MAEDSPKVLFDEFAASRWTPAFRLAYGLTGDRGAAEDLAQEALARIWSRWDQVQHTALDAYLRRTITNLFLSAARRQTRLKQLMRLMPAAGPASPADHELGDRHDLTSALRQLPPRQRVVVVLRYVEDLSVDDVAQALDCSPGTVKTQSSRGLASLRSQLTATYGGGSHG